MPIISKEFVKMKASSYLIIFSVLIMKSTQNKVKLGVYYSPFCGDSKVFFRGQLKRAVEKVMSIVDLKLVPFGKSKIVRNILLRFSLLKTF